MIIILPICNFALPFLENKFSDLFTENEQNSALSPILYFTEFVSIRLILSKMRFIQFA